MNVYTFAEIKEGVKRHFFVKNYLIFSGEATLFLTLSVSPQRNWEKVTFSAAV